MVAKITFPKRLEAALNYNERKAQRSSAVCIAAAGYLKEPGNLSFQEKLEGLSRLAVLNERASTKTIHVSLNFDPSEKLSEDQLRSISATYMERIGFGSQPYLVYKHHDAAHPHIHIVSTTIRQDGRRINTHNIGRNQSEEARKAIEQLYGLVPAVRKVDTKEFRANVDFPKKVIYGMHETKRAITHAVTTVFTQYKFSSLAEYNAALKQFAVVADPGKEGSRIHNAGGLVYRVLDDSGCKVGVPIKASAIACKPTLQNLELRYTQNEEAKIGVMPATKAAVEKAVQTADSLKAFVGRLQQQHIAVVLRESNAGFLYGITFVDNRTKAVFNGSNLGKGFSAAAIQAWLGVSFVNHTTGNKPQQPTQAPTADDRQSVTQLQLEKADAGKVYQGLLEGLLTPSPTHNDPGPLQKKRRKKRKEDRSPQ